MPFDRCQGLTDHECMRDVRLWNWGACGRQDSCRPDPERGSSAIYGMGKADGKPTIISHRCGMCMREQPDPGECCGMKMLMLEERIPAEPDPEALDHADADSLHGFIDQLSATHKHVIRRKFYLCQPVNIMDTDAAVRALLDLMADNRRVVNVMKRLGWT